MCIFDPLDVKYDTDDGTASLKNAKYKDLTIVFDQSVVEYLKNIEDFDKYLLVFGRDMISLTKQIWEIRERSNTPGFHSIHRFGGTRKRDRGKVVCSIEEDYGTIPVS
ncbi:hypothetical protein [Microcoleus sp. AT9b-C2]